ncbi:MAG: DUF5721 family protein [Clostridiales bacterium]|jgi:hypothetical protein|nr:DUF5721 family protein [Clostridiales bacterium]
MLAIKISETEIKQFMAILIKGDKFDSFETRGAEINSFTKVTFSCILDKDYFTNEVGSYAAWGVIKPYVFNIIKGNKRPKSLKIVFAVKNPSLIHENAKALFLNVAFDNNIVLCTTAAAQINFTMDKSIDMLWESYIKEFFSQLQITYTVL